MSRLSVALATYNGAAYLEEQLESIAWQTRLPDELVVRDDGSADDTVAILRAFAARAPFPVRVLERGDNLGYARNFGAVLAACTGDLVALSDQDDVWRPEKVARLEAALGDDPGALLAFSDLELVDGDLRPLGKTMWQHVRLDAATQARYAQGWAASPLLTTYHVTGAAALVRASLLELALPVVLAYYHDGWLALLAVLTGRAVPVPEPLVLYRQHGRNQIGAPERETFWEGIERRATRWHEGDRAIEESVRTRRELLAAVRQRLAERGRLPAAQAAVLERLEGHHAFRQALPPYPARLAGIVRELAWGRYAEVCGRVQGVRVAARDGLRRPLAGDAGGRGERS